MAPKKSAQWREWFREPEAMLIPSRGGMKWTLPVPAYVQRWLVATNIREHGADAYGLQHPALLAARVLKEACDAHYRSAPPPAFRLIRGACPVPANFEEMSGKPNRAGVSNGEYSWLFALPETPDVRERFTAWVREEWLLAPTWMKPGWPVITLGTGEWPIDPRLIPGTLHALPEMVGRLAS